MKVNRKNLPAPEPDPQQQIQVLQQQLTNNSILMARMQFAFELGVTFGGARNLYQVLGYKKQLTFQDYYLQYQREDLGKVVIDKVVNGCWANKPQLKDETGTDESPFEKEYDAFAKQFKLYSILNRLDKLLGLGDYAVLLLGFDDNLDFSQPVQPNAQIKYLQPYSCNSATITSFESDKTSERFGKPVMYQIQVNHETSSFDREKTLTTITIQCHYTRLIHVVEDPLESSIYGTPRMQSVFNRLQDVQKILGGSAESYWKNVSPGRVAKLDKDTTLLPGDKEDLKTQFDEYDHNLRRWLRVRGMDIQELSTTIADPEKAMEVQINVISAATGIPKRILMGSERGELASSQDEKAWNSLLYNRMVNFCEPCILRPLVDSLIEHKSIPDPVGGYIVEWPKMSALGEKEVAEIGSSKMEAMSKYLAAPGGTDILPLEIFFRDIISLPEDTVKEIMLKIEDAGGIEALEEKMNPEPEELDPDKVTDNLLSVLGGSGSGNHGHAGRPGKVGGSSIGSKGSGKSADKPADKQEKSTLSGEQTKRVSRTTKLDKPTITVKPVASKPPKPEKDVNQFVGLSVKQGTKDPKTAKALNEINSHMEEVLSRRPGLKNILDDMGPPTELVLEKGTHVKYTNSEGQKRTTLGLYRPKEDTLHIPIEGGSKDIAKAFVLGTKAYTVGGNGAMATVRHEFGHAVLAKSPEIKTAFILQVWKNNNNGKVAFSGVSRYATLNASEAFAEAFSAWSSPYYNTGKGTTLPKNIEQWFDNNLK